MIATVAAGVKAICVLKPRPLAPRMVLPRGRQSDFGRVSAGSASARRWPDRSVAALPGHVQPPRPDGRAARGPGLPPILRRPRRRRRSPGGRLSPRPGRHQRPAVPGDLLGRQHERLDQGPAVPCPDGEHRLLLAALPAHHRLRHLPLLRAAEQVHPDAGRLPPVRRHRPRDLLAVPGGAAARAAGAGGALRQRRAGIRAAASSTRCRSTWATATRRSPPRRS